MMTRERGPYFFPYFCTRKSKIKETAIPDKHNILAMSLNIFIIGSILIGGFALTSML